MSIGTANSASSSAPRELFGGAITANLPHDVIDASDLRQIPDNQEVFLSPTSETSIVFEILALHQDGAAGRDLWEAAKFHWESIAHDNASLSNTILTPSPTSPIPSLPLSTLPPCASAYTPPPTTIMGTQRIHKFSHDPSGAPRAGHEGDVPDEVLVVLALWRCWYEPSSSGTGTGSGAGGKKRADVVLSINVNLSAADADLERQRVEKVFEDAVESFGIQDWGLFADEE